MTDQNPLLIHPMVFCTVKYNKHYLVLCSTEGQAIAFTSRNDFQKMWRQRYTKLIQAGVPIEALKNHFDFYAPMLHEVKNIDQFENYVCPEPRRVVSAEYISGNCIGLTCNNENAEKLRAVSGYKVEVNFNTAMKVANRRK